MGKMTRLFSVLAIGAFLTPAASFAATPRSAMPRLSPSATAHASPAPKARRHRKGKAKSKLEKSPGLAKRAPHKMSKKKVGARRSSIG